MKNPKTNLQSLLNPLQCHNCGGTGEQVLGYPPLKVPCELCNSTGNKNGRPNTLSYTARWKNN